MNESEVNAVLSKLFRLRVPPEPAPSPNDWRGLSAFFLMQFPEEFIHFMNLLGNYYIEGGFLKVAESGRLIGDDTIVSAVICEQNIGSWPSSLVPFFGVGNGDYYCISRAFPFRITYIYHEDRSVSVMHNSFEEFLKHELPDFV